MRIYRVQIKGVSPLMQHRYCFSDEKESKHNRRSGEINYDGEWESSLYWDSQIGVFEPATHIEGALVKAATNFQIRGRGKKTYKDLFRSSVFIRPDRIPLGLNNSPKDLLSSGQLMIDRRTEVLGKGRIERLRPVFKNWSLNFEIEVHDDQIPENVLKEILSHAGRYCGLGERRPRFGRFEIVDFKLFES